LSKWIFVRGAGDIATGVIVRLTRCGFHVAALESPCPSAIRRTVSLCEAVYAGQARVEGVTARLVSALPGEWPDYVPLLIDPDCGVLDRVVPAALVDAILAKRNLGTRMDMALATVGLGPGFTAGKDVHAVVETMRGHNLGRVLWQGSALPNTGIPGLVGGYAAERVIHAPVAGKVHIIRDIGSKVGENELLATIDGTPVTSRIPGVVRGMIREGYKVFQGMKMADVDPRENADWHSVSDKALAVGGGVVEALMAMGARP
jgi:xanthine dehydrogenase accessory factor